MGEAVLERRTLPMRTVLPDDRSRITSILIVVLARPVPVRQPGQVTSSDAATSRSGPAADGIRDLPDGGGGGRSRVGRRQLPIRGRGGLWAGVHGRRGVRPVQLRLHWHRCRLRHTCLRWSPSDDQMVVA